jgi:Na+/melibiose symporter-like transporter
VLFASLTYGIIEAPTRGWSSPLIVLVFCLAAAALAGFVYFEPRRKDPLVDLRFFRSIPFAAATVTAVAAFATLGGFLFLNTLYLQDVRGLSALHAGLDTLPMAVMTMVASPISGRIVGSRGARIPLVTAGVALTAACIMLAQMEPTTPFTWLFVAYVVFGLGFGVVNAPITNAAVSGMPRAQAGVASAIASTSRQLGATLGVAVVGALVTSKVSTSASAGFAEATHAGWWVLAACGLVVLVLGVVATSRRALESAQRTARELNPEALSEASVR